MNKKGIFVVEWVIIGVVVLCVTRLILDPPNGNSKITTTNDGHIIEQMTDEEFKRDLLECCDLTVDEAEDITKGRKFNE